MGSGTKTAHKSYVIATAGTPESPIVVPVTEQPFLATEWKPEEWGDLNGEVALDWFNHGFGPGAPAIYEQEGIINPTTAKDFLDVGIGPTEVADWHDLGFTELQSISWKNAGFLPAEAAAIASNGLTPIEAMVANAEAVGAGEKLNIPLAVADEEAPAPKIDFEQIKCQECGSSWTTIHPMNYGVICPDCGHDTSLDDEEDDDLDPEAEEVQVLCPNCEAPWPAGLSLYDTKCPNCEYIPYQTLESAITDFNTEDIGVVEAALETVPEESAPIEVAPSTTVPDDGHISDDTWLEAVTPVPDIVPLGDPRGVPLLIGGADLEKGSATIMSYANGNNPAHEVLFCTINEEAEQKLLEALAPTEEKLVPVESIVQVHGRLEADKKMQVFEDAVTAAKSLNVHLLKQDGIPSHTLDRVKKLDAEMAGFLENDDSAIQEMVKHYKPLVDAMVAAIKPGYAVPYNDGGKIPMVTEFTTSWNQTQIEYVPDLSEATGAALLAASARKASRVDPTIINGVATWNGKSRSKAQGVEYVIQLPDGYSAVYHPYVYAGQSLASDHYSLRGQLEIHCPGGEGHAKDLVDVLGSLNIVNRPMNAAEAEWTYLQENIKAQGLEKNPAVAKAISSSQDLEKSVEHEILFKHADEAMGMTEAQIVELAQKLTLEVESSVLPLRVRIVRDAVAKASGFASGQDLAAASCYDPSPRKSGGWMVFDRFDVKRDESKLKKMFEKKGLRVHITGANSSGASILDIFKNGGVLASTERRRIMGAAKSTGMSESADMSTGGAKSAFVRVFSKGSKTSNAHMVWDDPLQLLKRSDWYGADHDTFGSINPSSSHTANSSTKDPSLVADFHGGGSNEVMFRDGLDLLGVDAPSKVYCTNIAERDAVRKYLDSQGIAMIGNKTVEDVIVCNS